MASRDPVSVCVPPAPAIETRGLFKNFGSIRVLKNVSFSIPAGESRALVGRNGAGKSTLVALMTGVLAPTTGDIMIAGAPAPALDDRRAWQRRVACVYQRWTTVPALTVAENLFLNNQPGSNGFVSWRTLRERARVALLDWGLDIDPDLDAWRLTVEQRQIVEIARALLQGSRFIILDEPTAELERREVNRLFDRIRRLQERDVTVCYISHHLREIYEICHSVSVMRDGELVAEGPLSEMPNDRLVAAMVGTAQSMTGRRHTGRQSVPGPKEEPALKLSHLSVGSVVRDVSFEIAAGECVGLAGLASSGKEEVAEAIAGLLRPEVGQVLVHGRLLPPGDVVGARRGGVGYVPRDRHEQALFPQLSLAENLTITVGDALGPAGFVRPSRRAQRADVAIRAFDIAAASPAQPIAELSGGNQQKAIVGRALASSPRVLVLVSPTQGVDIASKEALFAIVAKAQAAGTAVLVVSDDLDELTVCDRVLVIFRGALTHVFADAWLDNEMVAAIEGLSERPRR